MRKKTSIVLVVVFLLVAVSFALTLTLMFVNPVATLPQTTIYVEPPSTVVEPSQIFTVDVAVTDAPEFNDFNFSLYYDTTLLDAPSADAYPPFVGAGQMNDPSGYLWVSGLIVEPDVFMSGNVTLAWIEFHCTGRGMSDLTIVDPVLTVDGTPIAYPEPVGGVVVQTIMYWKPPEVDYAPSGMPDFSQKQDNWGKYYDANITWTWCGPTAVANSLWWLDSWYETGKIPPPTIHDTFPLVQSYNATVWDDHAPQNVPPLIEKLAWYMDCDGIRTNPCAWDGTYVDDMTNGINEYIRDKGLEGGLYAKMVEMPDFYFIEHEVERCEDVILLVGFWQWDPEMGEWTRLGGHYLTVAGVDSEAWILAVSDPYGDWAEPPAYPDDPDRGNGPGRVIPPPPHGHPTEPPSPEVPDTIHNNATYVSHDIYKVTPSESPGGIWQLEDYISSKEELVENMAVQNCPREFLSYVGEQVPGEPIYTEIEYAVVVSPIAPPVPNWPMFRHDLRHTGYSTSPAPTTNKTLWNYTTGFDVFSSPAVADGMVFIGSDDGNVYALNETTGVPIWSYTTGSWVHSSPAVADGMVFIGSFDKKVYALPMNDPNGDGVISPGEVIWSYTTGFDVFSSPAVADGMVFVGSGDYKVYALNETTGVPIWSYTAGFDVRSSPAVADGMVFIGSHDNNVYSLNASTGALIWSYTTGDIVLSCPAVADGMVFIGSDDYKVYALNETTGVPIWSFTTGSYVRSSPAVADGMVFIGSHDNKVYAFGPVHDVAITNVTLGKTVVGQNFTMAINATVANEGDSTETFNVTTYYNTTVFSEGFEGGTFAGWDFYYSTNGAQSGSILPGTWNSSIVSGANALSGSHSARLLANSTTHGGATGPWRVDAAINRTINRACALILRATLKFDDIQGSGGVGDSYFAIGVFNGLNISKRVFYGFSTTGDYGDIRYTVSPGELVKFERNIVTDYFNKYGENLPNQIMVRFLSSADYAEVIQERRTTDVIIDDIAIVVPSTPIETRTVTNLPPGEETTLTFTWNTTGVAKGNYTITAYANPVPGETDTADNTLTDGWVVVTIPADANGDGEVDTVDLSMLGRAWDTSVAEPHNELLGTGWNPNCDFNGDTKIKAEDISIMGSYWGQTDP